MKAQTFTDDLVAIRSEKGEIKRQIGILENRLRGLEVDELRILATEFEKRSPYWVGTVVSFRFARAKGRLEAVATRYLLRDSGELAIEWASVAQDGSWGLHISSLVIDFNKMQSVRVEGYYDFETKVYYPKGGQE
jgi:hypothetical protein